MYLRHFAAALLITGAAALAFSAAPAHAADTAVTCAAPTGTINTGQDGTSPRFTIQCTGGSSAGHITFFAYKFATNANLTALLERTLSSFVLAKGTGATVEISSNLSDTSGTAWGCGGANCRIIDYLTGY
jgi:hypothetical protein